MQSYIIYAREDCNFCKKLLRFMHDRDQKFIYVLMHNMDENLKKIMTKYNWRTVPLVIQVEENGEEKFIGGCDDTIELIKRSGNRANPLPDC